jgi:hypothetical protein
MVLLIPENLVVLEVVVEIMLMVVLVMVLVVTQQELM